MSKMFHAVLDRIQSVPERFLPRAHEHGRTTAMDVVLFLRLAAQSKPLELGRIAALRSLQHSACARLWAAGRDHGPSPPKLLTYAATGVGASTSTLTECYRRCTGPF